MAFLDKLKQAAATAKNKINEFSEENHLNETISDISDSIQKTWDDAVRPDVLGQIEKLSKMRDEGIITEDEFQQKKTELLKKVK